MTEGNHERTSNEDGLLYRLIRAARRTEGAHFVRPDDGAITAYVLGSATADQQRCVQAAIVESAAFRQELLQMMKDVEALSTPRAVDARAAATVVPPAYHDFLRSYGETIPRNVGLRRGLAWVKHLTSVRVYVPAAIASAGVIAVLLVRTVMYGPVIPNTPMIAQLGIVAEQLGKDRLITLGKSRSVPGKIQYAYSVPESAAVAAMRDSLIVYDDNTRELSLASWSSPTIPTHPERAVVLRLIDASGGKLAEFVGNIPRRHGHDAKRDEAFILSLPSRTLWSAILVSDTTLVEWQGGQETRGCVAYTFPCDHGFCAIPVSTFDLNRREHGGHKPILESTP